MASNDGFPGNCRLAERNADDRTDRQIDVETGTKPDQAKTLPLRHLFPFDFPANDAPGHETGLFYFDRAPRRTHLVPWTRESEADAAELWAYCERRVDEVGL